MGKVLKIVSLAFAIAFHTALQAQSPFVLDLPSRPLGAKSGTQLHAYLNSMTVTAREQAVYKELLAGNVPDFLRNLKPVTATATIGGRVRSVTYYVTPEYMCLGSDADYYRMPMTPILGQWLANALNCTLPTTQMVNQIWQASSCKLSPQTTTPDANMITEQRFWEHNGMVQTSRNANAAALGSLVGGHKKDVVITMRLNETAVSPRVFIYGWHYLSGTPIQPLSAAHESTYADYSHGVRLISNTCLLDGSTTTTVQAVLKDSALYTLLVSPASSVTGEGLVYNDKGLAYPVSAPPVVAVMPISDAFTSAGRQPGIWTDRFTMPAVVGFTPLSPGGDGYALRVRDTSGGFDATATGQQSDSDYFVEADIYCLYRPELAGDGFERVGIFARDDGNVNFTGYLSKPGNCYAMVWNGNNGVLACVKMVNGVESPLFAASQFPSSAWRKFRMECAGSKLTFKIDGETVGSATDSTFPSGLCGIGYHELFATNSFIMGTYADNFHADYWPLSGIEFHELM